LPDEILPRRFGRFELRELLGRGSFGVVYKAWDLNARVPVAIKMPRDGRDASPADVEFFLREARNAGRVRNHKNIVSMYEATQHDGVAYLVTELVEGTTLDKILEAGVPPFETTVELLACVLEALDFAHNKGLIHRDLKPQNILIDKNGEPRITDFGLAMRDGDLSTVLFRDRSYVGTPAYMSPEQSRGDSAEVNARSDVFSAGVLLYEMLTGEQPFRGQLRMIQTQIEVADPDPPRKLNDAIPATLETVCLKALQKDPNKRYPSAMAMAHALRSYREHVPLPAKPRLTRFLSGSIPLASSSNPLQRLFLGYCVIAGVFGLPFVALHCSRAQNELKALRAERAAAEFRRVDVPNANDKPPKATLPQPDHSQAPPPR
jgi:serine/threonine protein kinase